jgi:hypothetical protein
VGSEIAQKETKQAWLAVPSRNKKKAVLLSFFLFFFFSFSTNQKARELIGKVGATRFG